LVATSLNQEGRLFNRFAALRDKKVVSVFVHFRAPLHVGWEEAVLNWSMRAQPAGKRARQLVTVYHVTRLHMRGTRGLRVAG
jgi:hypothetical protein